MRVILLCLTTVTNCFGFGAPRNQFTVADVNLSARVGFQYRFAIILDDGESGLEIEEHFLHRLRSWRNSKGTRHREASICTVVAGFASSLKC